LGGTQPYDENSKNEMVVRVQEEGMGHPEISILTIELLASVDILPTSPYNKKNSSTNKEHQKPESPGNTRGSP
jgi:hypothetical protein